MRIVGSLLVSLAVGVVIVLASSAAAVPVATPPSPPQVRPGGPAPRPAVTVACQNHTATPPETVYDYFDMNLGQALSDIGAGRPVELRFFQRTFNLTLSLSSFEANAQRLQEPGSAAEPVTSSSYAGSIVGFADSYSRLTITSTYISGYVNDRANATWYFDEPNPDRQAHPEPYRGYREVLPAYNPDDGQFGPTPWDYCEGGGGGSLPGGGLVRTLPPAERYMLARAVDASVSFDGVGVATTSSGGGPQPMDVQTHRIQVGGDCEWVQRWGGDVNRAFLELENQVNRANGIMFWAGVTFRIIHEWLHVGCPDGALPATDCGTLLTQFRTHSLSAVHHNFGTFHVAHLMSGKNLQGSTLGCAWQPDINGAVWAHWGVTQHVSEGFFSSYWATDYERTILVAHEIGHNYNGDHGLAWWLPCGPFGLLICFTIMWPTFYGGILGLHMLPFYSLANAGRIHTEAHAKAQV